MSRVVLVRRGGGGTPTSSSTEVGTSHNDDKSHLKNAKGARSSMSLLGGLTSMLLIVGMIVVRFSDVVVGDGHRTVVVDGTSTSQRLVPSSNQPSTLSILDVAPIYQNCSNVLSSFMHSQQPLPPRPPSEWRKPLWVPSLMASGSASPSRKGDIVKEWIDALTGLDGGTKNYHMSMRHGKLKRCHGISETAACSMGHPFVPIQPEQQTQHFQPLVILVVRNFLTAFPASHADKHVAYHQPKGTQESLQLRQPSEDNWRQVRDEYLETSMKTWREMIRYWKKGGTNGTTTPGSDYYRVGLILPFEWMLDPLRGPGLLQQLADLYQQVGFDVVLPSSSSPYIPCLWYQVASKEWRRQEEELHSDYIPGYTIAQRDFMVREMEEEWQEERDDPVLSRLLQEYQEQMLRETRIDDPTSSSSTR